ncbi:tetratricopeptide repeat protein [Halieaceae bacterium IMCC14734]|uniref:Tetratricopeptide repeat protein n=1 Tax=Candidatus Litorirhabdus singularis TaxID=2518993 RepID=A0ABT3TJ09_9GAMM|nr:M48 family metalloprotease [Candidatus Litorirhabdus singularis]MCX2982254.1 tetratricopeptide repeat protein [Candidatus Litorirhabdus singularis]
MRQLLILWILAPLLLTTACAVNPVTGERELSLVSEQQEIAIGAQQYGPSQQSQGGAYVLDAGLQAYVSDIGHRLAAVSDRPDLPYEFVVLNNSIPNAWALPGGKIAVNRGLLVELDDEAELAAVIGHEIVHAAARHGASQMSSGALTGFTAQLATIAAASVGFGDIANSASQAGSAAFMAKYGRDDELESDKYGIRYMSKLGYDPQAAVSLQETFVRMSGKQQQDFVSGLFASHPPSQARVDANRVHARELPPGQRYRERYQQRIAQLKRDAPAYAKLDEALTALGEEQPQRAINLLDAALKIQPNEAQLWETRGHAWNMLKNSDNAVKAYSTAIAKNPAQFSPYLYRGITHYRRGETELAEQDLLASNQKLPTAVSAYYLGETSLANDDQQQALSYFNQVAQGGNKELSQLAQVRLAQLEMAAQPGKYIATAPYVGKDGYLYIAVRNNSSLTAANVKLELIQIDSSGKAIARERLQNTLQLNSGERVDIKTRTGPLSNTAAASQFRSQVINAEPVVVELAAADNR